MKHMYYHDFRGDNVMKFISVLSVLSNNSKYSYRLMFSQIKAYFQWRSSRYDWLEIDNIFYNSIPQMEDPQQMLFVETVNTPKGSFRVFSSFYLTCKETLKQLLYIAYKNDVEDSKLSMVYFLLHISDIIAKRLNYPRYLEGAPMEHNIYIPNRTELLDIMNVTTFSENEIAQFLGIYNLQLSDIDNLMLSLEETEFDKEYSYDGFSRTFEISPLLKISDGSYIVVFPATLLYTAYLSCYNIMIKEFGIDHLLSEVIKVMIMETGVTLQQQHKFIDQEITHGVPFLRFQADFDKVANVAIVLNDFNLDFNKALNISEQRLRQKFPDKKIFSLLVTEQLNEEVACMTFDNTILNFSIEELQIIMSQENMNLLNLYYFIKDKEKYEFLPSIGNFDLFAYYCDSNYIFYFDKAPSIIFVECGYGLSLRTQYLVNSDEHILFSPINELPYLFYHFSDIPHGVPMYTSYKSNLYVLQLSNNELWVNIRKNEINKIVCRDILIAVYDWLFAIEKKTVINLLKRNVFIDICTEKGSDFYYKKIDRNHFLFIIPLDPLRDLSVEKICVINFISFLFENELVNEKLSPDYIDKFIDSSGVRFMFISDEFLSNIMFSTDGVSSCYFVNERYCDVILEEIADFINIRGKEIKYNIEDSKNLIIKVNDFILNEIRKILNSIDVELFLKNLIALHHSMVYWSLLTQARYESLSKAYDYIDSEFKNPIERINKYAEMNILTQGLIENIILNNIDSNGKEFSLELMDRLFALVHFILQFGGYIDQLSEKVRGSELTILENGRLAIPRTMVERINDYFMKLRTFTVMAPDKYELFLKLKPSSLKINYKELNKIFKEEYGISFDQYKSVIDICIVYALENKTPITIVEEDDFFKKIIKEVLAQTEKEKFKSNFILSSILNDTGLRLSDKWIQRFNRPVQITSRPWILYKGHIYYTTKTLIESLKIKIERIENATLHCSSKYMNNYIGLVNKLKGREFTNNVFVYYNSLDKHSLHVFREVPISPRKILKADENLGDIDILLIDDTLKKIVCIEAKNYAESRTTYELVQQNRKIVSKELNMVLKRDQWCKRNIILFKQYVKDIDVSYTLTTIFLTCNLNAYNYFDHEEKNDLTFLSAIDIVEDPMIVFK